MQKLISKPLPTLLQPGVLNKLLINNNNFNKDFRILETNFGPAKEDYDKGHIKNSVFFDTMNGVEPTKMYPRNLPQENLFKDYVGNLGISNKHHLILYDRSKFGFFASSRVWWIFRLFGHEKISILSGGINNWLKNNYEITTEIPFFEKENFEVKENKNLVRNYEDIIENLESKKELVIDARPREDFEKINPILGIPNRIPNSVNVPYSELFDSETGTLNDSVKLAEFFKSQGVDLNQKLIASCNTSATACTLAFSAYLLGAQNVPIYRGSWTEYSQRKEEEMPGRVIC